GFAAAFGWAGFAAAFGWAGFAAAFGWAGFAAAFGWAGFAAARHPCWPALWAESGSPATGRGPICPGGPTGAGLAR
ncbi:hypothetical protein ACFVVL_10200, partial [Kitasatospora sp. NPDC058115]|uniref:hypothetical protein n=1 Tax=Kitasatospora sp. NPDC058115 TaxID=3346347 RepID=UPI0036DBB0E9